MLSDGRWLVPHNDKSRWSLACGEICVGSSTRKYAQADMPPGIDGLRTAHRCGIIGPLNVLQGGVELVYAKCIFPCDCRGCHQPTTRRSREFVPSQSPTPSNCHVESNARIGGEIHRHERTGPNRTSKQRCSGRGAIESDQADSARLLSLYKCDQQTPSSAI